MVTYHGRVILRDVIDASVCLGGNGRMAQTLVS